MAWDDSANAFQLVPVPTRAPSRCAVCQTQSGTDGPYGEALSIQLIDGTPSVCRRCMIGLLRLWGVVSSEYFAEVVGERDEARSNFAEAAMVRDEALGSVERLEGELAARVQEVHDQARLIGERDATIKAARAGRLDTPDVTSIAAQVKYALLEQPGPDAKKAGRKLAPVEAA
jgi:hypothetical protein